MARTENEILLFQMDANIRALSKKLDTARKDTDKTSRDIQKRLDSVSDSISGDLMNSINGAAAQVPVLGSALSGLGGVAGGVAAVGLAALAVGLHQAREAMLWSAEVTDLSEKLGITAEELQKLQFAADESGVPIEELHGALGNLNASLGAVKTGVGDAKIKKVFEALGLTKEDVAGVRTSAEFIPILADRISKLGSVSEQVKIAKSLGIEALVPLLARGAGGVAALTTEAERLGLVIDNQTVRALDELNREVEIAQQRIDVNLKKAFVGLAPVIADATNLMAAFIGMVGQAANSDIFDRFVKGFANSIPILGPGISAFVGNESSSGTGGGGRRGNPAAVREAARQAKLMKELMNRPAGGGSGGSAGPKSTVPTGPAATGLQAYGWLDLDWQGEIKPIEGFTGAVEGAAKALDLWNVEVQTADGIVITDKFEGLATVLGDVAFALGDAIAYSDDLGDTLSDVARRIVSSWATSGLLSIFGIDAQGKSTGGGLLGALKGGGKGLAMPTGQSSIWDILKGLPSLGGLFGGGFKFPGFAAGTPYAPGGLALVGERGPELMNVPRGARIYDSADTARMLAGARGGVAPIMQFDLRGAVMTQDILAQMNAMSQQAAMAGAAGGAQLSRAQTAKSQRNTLR